MYDDRRIDIVVGESVMTAGRPEAGQGFLEYALLLALIAIVSVAALTVLGSSVKNIFYGITEALQSECGAVSRQTFRSYAGPGVPEPSSPSVFDVWPAQGTVSQGYWFCHKGVDVAGDEGTPIVAIADGIVRYAGWSDKGYGNMAVIDHGDYQSLYAHLRSHPTVHTGETVAAGQVIGELGNTGHSTGPHLHFEIRVGSNLIDPTTYLP